MNINNASRLQISVHVLSCFVLEFLHGRHLFNLLCTKIWPEHWHIFLNVCYHESFQVPNVKCRSCVCYAVVTDWKKRNNGFGLSSDSHLVILLLCHRMKRGMWTDWIGVANERHVVLCDAVINWVHAMPNCRLQISNITMTNALQFWLLVKILWCLISLSVSQSRSIKYEFWNYLIFLRNLISLTEYNFSEF
jgi:hypothetical protein